MDVDKFVVRPGPPLEGTVGLGGAKNSVLKLMAACLLAEGRFTLGNVPRIADVETMSDVLVSMGVDVGRTDEHRLTVEVPAELTPEAPYELVEKMRASVVVLGPLLARCGEARVSMPGGDDFGQRPIEMHLRGLEAMGAEFETRHGYVLGRAQQLTGARIVLEFPSHTCTDNLLMAAVRAKGTTVIDNAAREPEVADLAAFLNRMGARIAGAGSSTIEVEGVDDLSPVEHEAIPDRVEAATYLTATGLAGGEVVVEGARGDHMDMFIHKLGEIGVRVAHCSEGLWVSAKGRPRSVDVATLPYPGVATDYKPLVVTLLSVADGVGIVTENIFQGRFKYVDELRRMGADIRTDGHHAIVRGIPRLSGAPVKAPDIRAGAALVLAGLVADGETVVSDAYHVDRGYEAFAEKLAGLGADVTRSR
ncbi:MAG TPA: UDP-N-acetylglucosamine 1-carboxyvinyltransferase [Acidimicrobiales bacterium]|nr:UDP-N-acetylglucosamine 1-carboxyvinyltransferase [Acidimicrobiales bacterium]